MENLNFINILGVFKIAFKNYILIKEMRKNIKVYDINFRNVFFRISIVDIQKLHINQNNVFQNVIKYIKVIFYKGNTTYII